MSDILLCSSNSMLVRNLYGILRDDGYNVDTVEHPSLAVKQVLWSKYDCAIVDSDPFGLPAQDAVQILRSVAPAMPVVVVGSAGDRGTIDLAELKRTIHAAAV